MEPIWREVFEKFGVKTVSKTDKSKGAFVPNVAQCEAIAAAGISPSLTRPANEFRVTVLNEQFSSIGASFYHSIRKTDPTRNPEPRMGHGFISSTWLQVGDEVLIGNVGAELFALKLPPNSIPRELIDFEIAKKASAATVWARARMAKGRPAKRTIQKNDFVRNPYVVQAAVLRAAGKCEMPKCANSLFIRDDGNPYLEVHHIVPLGENGEDTCANVAALCPHCHRELHFGRHRRDRRKLLAAHVASLPK
jgi:5-methylcytosine-specific restriction endonuclease McrA